MHKKHETKAEADKAAKMTKTEVKKIPKRDEKISYKPHYIPGSWKGTTENPKMGKKVSYKQRYIPGSWKGTDKPRYVPGSGKGQRRIRR